MAHGLIKNIVVILLEFLAAIIIKKRVWNVLCTTQMINLPTRARDQGNVIGLVSIYIVVIKKNCKWAN